MALTGVGTLTSFYGEGRKEGKADTAELVSWQAARMSTGRKDVGPFFQEGSSGCGTGVDLSEVLIHISWWLRTLLNVFLFVCFSLVYWPFALYFLENCLFISLFHISHSS